MTHKHSALQLALFGLLYGLMAGTEISNAADTITAINDNPSPTPVRALDGTPQSSVQNDQKPHPKIKYRGGADLIRRMEQILHHQDAAHSGKQRQSISFPQEVDPMETN